MSAPPFTLIATLGSEPQVVTLALDLLQRKGYSISQVVLVHTNPSHGPIREALTRLNSETKNYPSVNFRSVPIQHSDGTTPTDIVTEEDAGAVFSTLYREVLHAKRRHHGVHLSIAGGRKVMSVYGMAVAQLLFDENDYLWHLLSEGKLLHEGRMHPEPNDKVWLIPIPVLRWSSVAPVFTELMLTEDPYQAIRRQRERWACEALQRKRHFFKHVLTEAERELVEHLVRKPTMTNAQLARRIYRSESTIANQLSSIYRKFEEFFRIPKARRGILIAELAPLFARRQASNK